MLIRDLLPDDHPAVREVRRKEAKAARAAAEAKLRFTQSELSRLQRELGRPLRPEEVAAVWARGRRLSKDVYRVHMR